MTTLLVLATWVGSGAVIALALGRVLAPPRSSPRRLGRSRRPRTRRIVPGERGRRILDRLAAADHGTVGSARLCVVGAEVTGMTGAGIMLMADDRPRGSVCTSDAVSAVVERLQYELGEGPCLDAFRQDRPVAEPALADPVTPRWLAFTGPAVDAGVLAVFSFPLRVGAARLGALHLHRDRPGPLTDEEHADAVVLAEVGRCGNFRHVVHQATGMVAVQLDVTVAEAPVRLRAHAFGNELTLAGVARSVVDRALRFDGSNR